MCMCTNALGKQVPFIALTLRAVLETQRNFKNCLYDTALELRVMKIKNRHTSLDHRKCYMHGKNSTMKVSHLCALSGVMQNPYLKKSF